MYLDENSNRTSKTPSLSGYGAYINSENPTSNQCINQGYWQYDFPKYLTFGINTDLKFDQKTTRSLLKTLLSKSETQTIFIEPYLKQKLQLDNEYRIRFHGCYTVRHDDHIHLQIK